LNPQPGPCFPVIQINLAAQVPIQNQRLRNCSRTTTKPRKRQKRSVARPGLAFKKRNARAAAEIQKIGRHNQLRNYPAA
jgi:hypothetical protein